MSSAQLRLYLKPEDQSRFILGTFKHFSRERRFQRKWQPTEHWTALMHMYYDKPEPLKCNGNNLKDELRKDPVMKTNIKQDHKLPNLHGIYHDQYRPGKQNIHCYYACKPVKAHVYAPSTGEKWYESIPSIQEILKECEAIARLISEKPTCIRQRL
jgi:hypothetical protein